MSGPPPAFALLTDFGLADPYVGQLKAILFSHAPSVPILDISHEVPSFNVTTGAFFLAASRRYYPQGTIFICVVDPGVGSNRDLLCIAGEKHTLLGPDNGLLSLAYRDMMQEGSVTIHTVTHTLPERDNAGGNAVSATFHGRDILAPIAALLANGAAITTLSTNSRTEIVMPAWSEAQHAPGEGICTVLHVDKFGNCILNLPNNGEQLFYPSLSVYLPHSGKSHLLHQVSHYAALPSGTLGILPGGQGFYELALANSSAAQHLGLTSGDRCHIRGDLWKSP